MVQIRGHKTPNQQFGYSNPDYLNSFLIEFLLLNIGSLIELLAALLLPSVSKITSGSRAVVRT